MFYDDYGTYNSLPGRSLCLGGTDYYFNTFTIYPWLGQTLDLINVYDSHSFRYGFGICVCEESQASCGHHYISVQPILIGI